MKSVVRTTALFGVALLLLTSIAYVLFVDRAIVLDVILAGRIPGTEVIVSFDMFFAGVVFFAWVATTYFFGVQALDVIRAELKGSVGSLASAKGSQHTVLSHEEIEQIAL